MCDSITFNSFEPNQSLKLQKNKRATYILIIASSFSIETSNKQLVSSTFSLSLVLFRQCVSLLLMLNTDSDRRLEQSISCLRPHEWRGCAR